MAELQVDISWSDVNKAEMALYDYPEDGPPTVQTIPLPIEQYKTMTQLLAAIAIGLNTARITISINSRGYAVVAIGTSADGGQGISFSKTLAIVLGLEPDRIYTETHGASVKAGLQYSKGFGNLFIYADIVALQYVGWLIFAA